MSIAAIREHLTESYSHVRFDLAHRPSVRRGVLLFLALMVLNLVVAGWVWTISHAYPMILGLCVLAWGLGVRHALDTDHIAAIDNATRRLLYRGKPSVGVGFYFSVGHSLVVFLFTIALLYFSDLTRTNLDVIRGIGSVVAGVVSSAFLIVIGIANLVVMFQLIKAWRDLRIGKENSYHGHMHIGGPIERVFRPLLRFVDHSAKMIMIGFLFGLGFDTATEIGLLSLSAMVIDQIPIWHILILPVAFMAGMTLFDTCNSLLMLGIYTARVLDEKRQLFYNLCMTALSAFSALLIGTLLALQFVVSHFHLDDSPLGTLLSVVHVNQIGYMLIIGFVLSWLILLIGKPRDP